MNHKTKYSIYSFIILSTSMIYFLLVYAGMGYRKMSLDDVDKYSGLITESGVKKRKKSNGSGKVFYFRVDGLEETLGVFRAGNDYKNLERELNVNSQVTAYFTPTNGGADYINIDVLQVESGDKVLYAYSEYQDKNRILIIIGLVFGIGTVIGSIFYFRMNVLNTDKLSA